MLTMENVDQWRGCDLVDSSGDKIGSIDDIYLDDDTGQPEFALVKTGFFGTGSHFVPLQTATQSGDQIQVPFTKDQVKDAPGLDADDHLSQEQEARLYSHYGISYSESRSDSGLPEGGVGMTDTGRSGEVWDSGAVGRDTSG